ncbi:MAG: Fic family protein [Candidatus Sungbacteria bacterium]|uniref:protein adenylyltransferase n=1 Tax=Candidatus Sungiibacteriota bacterium TaxID=2750080 RepID=A0A932QY88_9BACT|nr:Fic family protein [Candidatus Sungbacteria bacterium]
MPKYSNDDQYIDPNTGVLKNLLNIASESELEENEATFASIGSFELAKKPLPGKFDLAHLKALHHYLFQEVYEWAGECRTIDITKGENFFAHHSHIESAARPIFEKLAEEKYLINLNPVDFSGRAAHYLGEINALHPFREGNGRAQREFISHLAYKNGYYIEWKHISQPEMIQASIESFKGDCTKFAAYILANLKNLP